MTAHLPPDWRAWLEAAPVARLATLDKSGAPHLVPVVFVVRGDAVWIPVDGKAKRHSALARLANIARDPRCCLLIDTYAADWRELRWLRLDGRAEIHTLTAGGKEELTTALRRKYPQYAMVEPLPAPATAICFRWHKQAQWSALPEAISGGAD